MTGKHLEAHIASTRSVPDLYQICTYFSTKMQQVPTSENSLQSNSRKFKYCMCIAGDSTTHLQFVSHQEDASFQEMWNLKTATNHQLCQSIQL